MTAPMFPVELFRIGPVPVTDTMASSAALALVLVLGLGVAARLPATGALLEAAYDALERHARQLVTVDPGPLVPLVLAQWLFVLCANLIGLVPGVASPTRDPSVTTALALVSFAFGHAVALRRRGLAYLADYARPSILLLPFNVIGEVSRTLGMSMRLFGNMLSGTLIGALLVSLVGLLVPLPMLALSALSAVVQAYIFGVLTLVFAAAALEVGSHPPARPTTKGAP